MSKGTLVLIPFPFTDLSGHKVRPALILHTSKTGEDCIALFISSVPQKTKGQLDVLVSPSESNGLKVFSAIKINKIATLQKRIIIGEVGVLEPSLLKEVDGKLKILLQI